MSLLLCVLLLRRLSVLLLLRGALLRVVLLRLPLFLVLLFGRLWPAFRSLLLGLLLVLFLLLVVLLLLLLVLFLVLMVIRPADRRSAGQGERTDRKDGALESLQLHAFSFSDAPRNGPKVACRCPHTR